MTLQTSQLLSHYRLSEKIGEGGMGVVWKAEDTILGRTVAIKVLPADVSRDPVRKQMFLEEARLASTVSDARIVQVHEFGCEGDLEFIVMEYVDGRPLDKLIHGRPLPPDNACAIGEQVARALSRAHRKRLIHRDLKPANILVTPDGEVKVADFGLAILFAGPVAEPDADRTQLGDVPQRAPTRLAGTLAYMSPEQLQGEKLDERSDIFALGVVLYEMTTGQKPFRGASAGQQIDEILAAKPRPPHELVPKLPVELERIILKALARARGDRYQSMEDFAVDLKRLARDLEAGPSLSFGDVPPRPRRDRRLVAAAVGLPLLVAAALGGWQALRPRFDARTVLVLPVTILGQDEGAQYAGMAFAQSLMVNLAQVTSLSLPPVASLVDLEDGGLRLARKLGAGRILSGSVIRDKEAMQATVNLVDAARNRIVWACEKRLEGDDLSRLAAVVSAEAMTGLGVEMPSLYDYILHGGGSPALASSPDFAATLGALRISKPKQALDASQRLVAEFPSEPYAWALRGWTMLDVWYERPTPALRAELDLSLGRLEQVDPDSPYLQICRAYLAYREVRYDDAVRIYTRILERTDITNAFKAQALRLRARCRSNREAFAEAERDLNEALGLDVTNGSTHQALSSLLRRTGRGEQALAAAQKAISLKPDYWGNHAQAAYALYDLRRFDEAEAAARRSVAATPSQATHSLLARVLMRRGHAGEAEAAAQRALAEPDDPAGGYNLACYFAQKGDRGRALEMVERANAVNLATLEIDSEPELEPLHGDPRFASVLEQVRARIRR